MLQHRKAQQAGSSQRDIRVNKEVIVSGLRKTKDTTTGIRIIVYA
jgi:hypothetical protein